MSDEAIVLFSTESQIDQVRTTISSCYHSGCWRGDFVVFLDSCSDYNRKDLEDKGIIVVVFDKEKYHNIFRPHQVKTRWHFYAAYIYLLFFFKCFRVWEMVLYLDTDVIVNKKINIPKVKILGAHFERNTYCEELENGELNFFNPNFIHNIRYQISNDLRDNEIILNHFGEYILNSISFNSGVLVFNPRFFTYSDRRKLLKIIQNYMGVFRFPDQGVLSLMFADRWEDIGFDFGDKKWLIQNISQQKKINSNAFNIIQRQMISHFHGKKKPWIKDDYMYPLWLSHRERFKDVSVNTAPDRLELFMNKISFDLEKYSDENIYNTLNFTPSEVDFETKYSGDLS